MKRDPDRAHEMFAYAASYFRDPDAQYYLARQYLDGAGAPRDPRTAARWFGLSAQKGQCSAQAMLGAMLFSGDTVPRQAARGLMWLTLAKDNAQTTDQPWIGKLYDSAFQQATEDERALAAVYLKRWLETMKARPAVKRGMALGMELRAGIDMKDPKVQAVLFGQRARAS